MLMDSDGFLWILMVRISGYGDLHGANFQLWKFASAGVPFKGSRLRAAQGFLNFFNHFGPLAYPMQGRVDLDLTDFSRKSRRIHPQHPEFVLRGWMPKS